MRTFFLGISYSEGTCAELAKPSIMLLLNGLEQDKTLFCSSFNINHFFLFRLHTY